MPPQAEVLVVEDHQGWQEKYASILSGGGHRVAGKITHILFAAAEIDNLKTNRTKIDVAIVDGNLGYSHFGEDGIAVIGMLRKEFPQIKIVGSSADPAGVKGADVNVDKTSISPDKLVEIITNI